MSVRRCGVGVLVSAVLVSAVLVSAAAVSVGVAGSPRRVGAGGGAVSVPAENANPVSAW